jgi:hypothetical protein
VFSARLSSPREKLQTQFKMDSHNFADAENEENAWKLICGLNFPLKLLIFHSATWLKSTI